MNRIKELRKEAGLTQADLASKLGVNTVTLSRYETGDRNPKLDKLEKMADLFHVSIDYITCKTNSRTGADEHWDELAKKINVGVTKPFTKLDVSITDNSETHLLNYYKMLNHEGQQEALKQVKNLTKISDYKK